jgi:hypothetical protein
MFGKKGAKDYSEVNLDDFSDDDSSADGEDFVQKSVRNQQVRKRWSTVVGIWNILGRNSRLTHHVSYPILLARLTYIYIFIITIIIIAIDETTR